MKSKYGFKYFFSLTKPLMRNRNYNFYEVLGVNRDCTNDEIKSAYLKLAKQYHPDLNKDEGAEEQFKLIIVAYEALNNQRNRDLYDAYMYADPNSDNDYDFFKKNEPSAEEFYKEKAKWDKYYDRFKDKDESEFWGKKGDRKGWKNASKEAYEENIFKDFESIFNFEFKKKEQKGQDIFLEIQISFSDSFFGATKGINVKNRKELCKSCKGTKCAPGFRPSKCFTCGGTGIQTSAIRGSYECNYCKGKGVLIKNPCK